MTSIRIFSLALALGFASVQVSCSNDESKQESGELNQTVDDLYSVVKGVEKDLSQGYLLRSASERERVSFQNILYDIKISTMRLRKDAQDAQALSSLYLASQEFDKLNILSQDGSQLEGLMQKLRETLDVLARIQGKTLENIERVLFAKEFDYELAPFTTVTSDNKKGWTKSNHLEFHYALATGSKLNTWLFSPVLDLSSVVNPSFNVSQAISNRGNSFADSVFFMVSEDYAGGDPALSTWDTIAVERLPDGSGYANVDSEDVSLKRYEGKRIVIGFHYDSRNASSYPTWQLNSFNLLGSGSLTANPLTLSGAGNGIPTAFEKVFNSPGATMAPFVAYTKNGFGGWAMGNYKSSYKDITFAQANFNSNEKTPLTSWLISPRFDLANFDNPGFRVTMDWVGGADLRSSTSFLVSTDFAGGDPELATWKPMTVKSVSAGEKFTSASDTEIISLNEFAGKKVVIALKVDKAANGNRLAWQVEGFKMFGEGVLTSSPVTVPKGTASGTPSVVTPPTGGTPGTAVPAAAGVPNIAGLCTSNAAAKNLFSFQFATADLTGNFTKIEGGSAPVISAPNLSYNQVIRFSAYRSTGNIAGTSWLVSKSIDLAKTRDACLSVADDAYFADAAVDLNMIEVLVSTDYTSDVATATWKRVEFGGRKAQTGKVNKDILAPQPNGIFLKDVIGDGPSAKITVAFRYTATESSAPWWGVQDLTVTAIPAE